MAPQPLLEDQQYKDVIVFLAHQQLEAVKLAANHGAQAAQAAQVAESLSRQLQEARKPKAEEVKPAASPLPTIDADASVPTGAASAPNSPAQSPDQQRHDDPAKG